MDEAEAYSRRDCAILSGGAIPGGTSKEEDVCGTVVGVLKDKLGVTLSKQDISTAHRMGPKPPGIGSDTRKIVVKFVRRDVRNTIMSEARTKKVPQLYIADCLSPTRRSIFFSLRKIKKAHPDLVKSCSTFDGRVMLIPNRFLMNLAPKMFDTILSLGRSLQNFAWRS